MTYLIETYNIRDLKRILKVMESANIRTKHIERQEKPRTRYRVVAHFERRSS